MHHVKTHWKILPPLTFWSSAILFINLWYAVSNFKLLPISRFTRRSRSTVTMANLPGMRTAAPSSRVELRIRCKDLLNKDVTSKSDPCAVIYMQEGGRWYEVGIYVVLCTRKIFKKSVQWDKYPMFTVNSPPNRVTLKRTFSCTYRQGEQRT